MTTALRTTLLLAFLLGALAIAVIVYVIATWTPACACAPSTPTPIGEANEPPARVVG